MAIDIKKLNSLNCYSLDYFNLIMKQFGFTSDGKNVPDDIAIISILEPEDNRGKMMDNHYFSTNKSNIINLDFDDIDADLDIWNNFYKTVPEGFIVYKGQLLRQITDNQAEQIVKFICENIGKKFFIHCYAGVSRSKAVTQFIFTKFNHYYRKEDCKEWGDIEIPNKYVIKKLNEAFDNFVKNGTIIEKFNGGNPVYLYRDRIIGNKKIIYEDK